MIKITRFFYVSVICFPLFAVSYFTGALHTLLLAYSIAAIHEIFHLLAALILSVRVKSIILMPFGMTLRLADSVIKSPLKEALIAFAGPFANILMICISAIMEKMFIWGGTSLFLFKYLNVAMFVINMLPCMPLDGGRIFKAFLVPRIGYINAVSFQHKTEKIIVAVMSILGIILIIVTKFNISLVMIAAFLAFNMIGEESRKNYIIMHEIMNSKEKLRRRKYMQTKILTVRSDIKAGELIRRFGYDSFYMVNVADKNLSLLALLSEADIIFAIEKYGFNVRIGEIPHNRKRLTS